MKKIRWLALLLILGLLLAACGGGAANNAEETAAAPAESTGAVEGTGETPDEVGGTVLRVGAPDDSYILDAEDPGRVTVGMSQVNTNIFESLTRMDANFQVQPALAGSWEYLEAEGAWRFHLREGVTFHNGEPLTAQAVVEMIQRVSQGGFAIILQVDENSATAVDELTVDIKTTVPNAQLPGQIAHPNFGIRAPGSDPFAGEHVGTGRFMLKEYVPDDHITVVKNPNYWGEPARVDEIIFRFIPDPNTRVLALQGREVDLIYDVPREAAVTLQEMADIQLISAPVGAYQAVAILATGRPPHDIGSDPLVREAIAYALNRQAIIDTAFDGFAEPVQTLIPPAVLGANAGAVTGYTYDPERAVSLLEEAGWVDSDGDGVREKGGRTLTLEIVTGFPTANDNGQTPEIIQAQLAEVGIETTITAINDEIAYDDRLTAQEGDLWVEIGNQNSASPCFLPFYLYYGGNPEPNNYQLAFAPTFVGVEGFDAAMDACIGAFDPAESAEHAANAMHILIDEARTALPLLGLYRVWATSSNVTGFEAHPIFAMIQWDQVAVAAE